MRIIVQTGCLIHGKSRDPADLERSKELPPLFLLPARGRRVKEESMPATFVSAGVPAKMNSYMGANVRMNVLLQSNHDCN